MNLICLAIIFHCTTSVSDTSIYVRFNHEYANFSNTSISVPEKFNKILGDSISVAQILQAKSLIRYEMLIDNKGNYCSKFGSSNAGFQMKTVYYYFRDGRYSMKDDTTSITPMYLTIKEGPGVKEILKYKCREFMAYNSKGDLIFKIWATKDLPESITGFHTLVPFGSAVLELEAVKWKWKRTAIEVKKLTNTQMSLCD